MAEGGGKGRRERERIEGRKEGERGEGGREEGRREGRRERERTGEEEDGNMEYYVLEALFIS